jgi:hypothetical protein
MLLHLTATTGFAVDLTDRSAEMSARAEILDAWDVPVDELNRVMPEHGELDPPWRNVLLDPAQLVEFKVI